MISKVFLILSSIMLVYSVNMRLYDVAGDYILTPEDYEFQDDIIIELWGAGSGSMSYIKRFSYMSCSGNSGAYIKAKIDTTNQETFYFSLGIGGNCTKMLPNTEGWDDIAYGLAGNYSMFYSEDKELFLNVSGGSAQNQYTCSQYVAMVNSTKHRADDILIYLINGSISNQDYKSYYNGSGGSCLCNDGYGVNAPFGHNGGINNGKQHGNTCSGYMGSGAGYSCNLCITDENGICVANYKGGDGALIVYY